MTSIWGPLGWMTLHSVAHNYSDTPSKAEKQLVSQWVELFRDTITCPTCQKHFSDMLDLYKSTYPYYLDSRTEFILFTYRAHNTVNRRLDKPIYHTAEECESVFASVLATRSAKEYRLAYIAHIQRHWTMMRDANGMSRLRKLGEMNRIERDYWSSRENTTRISGYSVSPLPEKAKPATQPMFRRPNANVSFTGGRLRFQK
jgi:hypothetical protein